MIITLTQAAGEKLMGKHGFMLVVMVLSFNTWRFRPSLAPVGREGSVSERISITIQNSKLQSIRKSGYIFKQEAED